MFRTNIFFSQKSGGTFYERVKLAIWQSIRELERRLEGAGWVPVGSLPDNAKLLADVAASAKHAAELEEENRRLVGRIAHLDRQSRARQDFGGRTFEELSKAMVDYKLILKLGNGGMEVQTDLLVALDKCAGHLAQGVTNQSGSSDGESEIFHCVASQLVVLGLAKHLKVPPSAHWQRIGLSELGQKFLTELRVRRAEGKDDGTAG